MEFKDLKELTRSRLKKGQDSDLEGRHCILSPASDRIKVWRDDFVRM